MTDKNMTTEIKLRDKEKQIKKAEERLERQKKQLQKERSLLIDKRRREYNHRTYVLGGLVRKAGLGNIDNETILGAFLAINDRVNSSKNDHIGIVNEWKKIGKKAINDAEQRVPARLKIADEKLPDRSELARIRELGLRKVKGGIWQGDVLQEKADLYAFQYGRNVEFL